MNDTKTIILQKSLQLFLQKSYKEVTLDDIVKAIGLTKGAFYHHYKSKIEVFTECVRYFYQHVMISDFSIFPKASLKAFYTAYITHLSETTNGLEETPDQNILMFIIEAQRRVSTYSQIHAQQRETERNEWQKMVDRAQKNKEISSVISSRHIASMFLNLSDGIALNNIALMDKDNALEEIKTEWDNLYKLLGGE